MEAKHDEQFSFVCHGLGTDTFSVISFTGTEKMSFCYEYDILLLSKKSAIDFDDVLQKPATLTIRAHRRQETAVHGVAVHIEQRRQIAHFTVYRIVLRPRLYWLTLIHNNQIFLDKDLKEIITAVLEQGGLSSADFEFKLQKTYPKLDYVCQFRETHLNFISRWMERIGIYYYFDQSGSQEKLVITDTMMSSQDFRQDAALVYADPSGLGEGRHDVHIYSMVCRQHVIPNRVRVRDYNYETPSVTVEGTANTGSGNTDGQNSAVREKYLYGGGIASSDAAKASAGIRAQAITSTEKTFHAETTVSGITPGYLYSLTGHFRDDCNREYLAIEVFHEGSQPTAYSEYADRHHEAGRKSTSYRNRVNAIASDVTYRPERKHRTPRFFGTLSAKVDAAGNGDYAELDDKGRYKVIMPFDLSGRSGGNASKYLRMMQPYAGHPDSERDYGMHLPLHKGAEVLISFIEGDPDRPVIAGALPNPDTPSPVTSSNHTEGRIVTASGNTVCFDDNEEKERIVIDCPEKESRISMGEKPDEDEMYYGYKTKDGKQSGCKKYEGVTIDTGDHLDLKVKEGYHLRAIEDSDSLFKKDYELHVEGDYEQHTHGKKWEVSGGEANEIWLGEKSETTIGTLTKIHLANVNEAILALMVIIDVAFKFKGELAGTVGVGVDKTLLHNFKKHLSLKHNEIHALKELVGAERSELVAELEDVVAQKNTAALEVDLMILETLDTMGVRHQVLGELGQLIANRNELGAEENRIKGLINQL